MYAQLYQYACFTVKTIINTLVITSVVMVSGHAATHHTDILAALNNKEAVKSGENLFLSHCAACHAKDLSGAVGFNLKDGEWVHGSRPLQIFTNISQGFSNAGMPGFKGILNDEDIKKITAFILSKREGFENLEYKIFHLEPNDSQSFERFKDAPEKSGNILNNYPPFDLPEVKFYGIEFSGNFYAPPEGGKLATIGRPLKNVQVIVNGKKIAKVKPKPGIFSWDLQPGKQHLTIRYINLGENVNVKKNLSFYVMDNAAEIRLFPVSSAARKKFETYGFNITAQKGITTQRKKVVKLPTSSVSVGFPEGFNYAFNTLSCGIVGMWRGEFLNVGPNVDGRGQDGSIPLGQWIFHNPDGIFPKINRQAANCTFNKYNRKEATTFYFTVEGIHFSAQITVAGKNTLVAKYNILATKKERKRFYKNTQQKYLSFSLPHTPKLMVNPRGGTVKDKLLMVDIAEADTFTIELTVKEEN